MASAQVTERATPSDTIRIIAEALRQKFGDGAPLVAERQLAAATPETADAWLEVIELLAG